MIDATEEFKLNVGLLINNLSTKYEHENKWTCYPVGNFGQCFSSDIPES